jgi:hypothetical protein
MNPKNPKSVRALASLTPLILLLSACASAPAPSAPAPTATEPEPKTVSLVCHDKSTAIRFADIGVPEGERALAVAVQGDNAYVLFRPGRLVRLTRREGRAQVEMSLAPPGEKWTSMAVDPTDGSLWISSDHFALRRFDRDWNAKGVQLKRVVGTGGFASFLVAPDAIYARPFCAEDGIWRIDREGNILSSAFPAPPPDPATQDRPMNPDELRCSPVRLERDPEGRIVVWNPVTRTLHQADAQGTWTEVPPSFFAAVRQGEGLGSVVKGRGVGSAEEQWYLKGDAGDLFYWKGRPIFFGGLAMRSRGGHNTVLLVPREDGSGFEELVESCYKLPIFDVATDGPRYAAITDQVVVFGDFATAPDLP